MWQPPHTSYVNGGAKIKSHFPAHLQFRQILCFSTESLMSLNVQSVRLEESKQERIREKRLSIILNVTEYGTDILNKK